MLLVTCLSLPLPPDTEVTSLGQAGLVGLFLILGQFSFLVFKTQG